MALDSFPNKYSAFREVELTQRLVSVSFAEEKLCCRTWQQYAIPIYARLHTLTGSWFSLKGPLDHPGCGRLTLVHINVEWKKEDES